MIASNRIAFNNVNSMTNKDLLNKILNAGANRGLAYSLPTEGSIEFPSSDKAELSWSLYKGSPMLAVSCKVNGKQQDLPIYLLRHTASHPVEAEALEAFRKSHEAYTDLAWRRGIGDLEWVATFLGKTWELHTTDITETVTRNGIERQFSMRIAALEEPGAPKTSRRRSSR